MISTILEAILKDGANVVVHGSEVGNPLIIAGKLGRDGGGTWNVDSGVHHVLNLWLDQVVSIRVFAGQAPIITYNTTT